MGRRGLGGGPAGETPKAARGPDGRPRGALRAQSGGIRADVAAHQPARPGDSGPGPVGPASVAEAAGTHREDVSGP